MDSSNSQHSQPPSSSDPSAENNAPELPGDNSSSGYQDEEDMNVDTTNSWTPAATKSSARKEKKVDIAAASPREGKAEEIGLLTDLYNLHNKTGRYLLSDERDFYKFWIEEERDYANKQELDEKMNELHARFLKNMDKNVDGPVDPIAVEILRLSHWIWGSEVDETDEDDQEQDSKDLSVDVNPDDSSHNGVDHADKDSTKESDGIRGLKDSSSKENGNGFAAS
ncbi:hypothetical protein L1987_76913 [Smallanthus sonchifolius]|uniref:Uncharacterized protein n=1 Tax=Smallanthus sonchifolius TaxID=185202 RepID=A0ACB8Z8R0_9ASTR|nr:hypothetical protein L1987_76913 [Smallanthus sonchifolius]